MSRTCLGNLRPEQRPGAETSRMMAGSGNRGPLEGQKRETRSWQPGFNGEHMVK